MFFVRLWVAQSHSAKCFLCGKKRTQYRRNRLKRINIETLGYCYIELDKLIVKSDARVCVSHTYPNSGKIKEDHYSIHKDHLDRSTRLMSVPKESQLMFESILVYQETKYRDIFEKFKDMDSLKDEHCIKITGWKKNVFSNFIEYLTDIKSTETRTKEEIVAIYRYWLRKGMTQSCNALYKNDSTSQQMISYYLDMVRVSVHKNFVPIFLGCKEDRSFFLKHRTETSKICYDLKENDLCFIADGTYIKFNKSRNHQFQYNSWSSHKKKNLMKPMIVCCPDGYIVDAYGPFFATLNDANIMDIVLNGDELFNQMVSEYEGTCFVLDRGFRDCLETLKEMGSTIYTPTITTLKEENDEQKREIDYKPSLKERREQQKTKGKKKVIPISRLTVNQTSRSRLTTKVRWIIEAINGRLSHLKGLVLIENNEIGHMMIDIRNACAMLNFEHNEETYQKDPNNEYLLETARLLRKKATEQPQINKLLFLLKDLNPRLLLQEENWHKTSFKNITDFPKLKRKHISRRITLGSYQLKTCEDYISSMAFEDFRLERVYELSLYNALNINDLKHEDHYNLRNKLLKGKSKIISVVVTSRHSRSAKNTVYYTVLVRYKPIIPTDRDNNHVSSRGKKKCIIYNIEGYVCTCDLGKRIAGACVHVTAALYYTSRMNDVKDNLEVFRRADYLNKVFINIKEGQKPNEPQIVRNKRRNNKKDYESSEDSCDNLSNNELINNEYISETESEVTEEIIQSIEDKNKIRKKRPFRRKINENFSSKRKVTGSVNSNKKRTKKNQTDSEEEFLSANESEENSTLTEWNTVQENNDQYGFSDNDQYEFTPVFNLESKSDEEKRDSDENENNLIHINPIFDEKDSNEPINKTNLHEFYKKKFNIKESFVNLGKLIDNVTTFSIKAFRENSPIWSARIVFNNKRFVLTNTCSLDYGLFGLWITSKLNRVFISDMLRSFDSDKVRDIVEVINLIDKKDWDKARENWLLKILTNEYYEIQTKEVISIFGSTEDIFYRHLWPYQKYNLYQHCKEGCSLYGSQLNIMEDQNYSILLKKRQNSLAKKEIVLGGFGNFENCSVCNYKIEENIIFEIIPHFICMSYLLNSNITLTDIIDCEKLTLETNGESFKFLFGIHYDNGHFTAIFYIFDRFFKVNDIKSRNKEYVEEINPQKNKSLFNKILNSAFYYKVANLDNF